MYIEMIFGWGRKRPKVREAAPSRKNIEMSAIPQAISDLSSCAPLHSWTRQGSSDPRWFRD